jgi:hypothetical protein
MDDLVVKDVEDTPLPGESGSGPDDASVTADSPLDDKSTKDETTLKRSAPDTDGDAHKTDNDRRKRPATEHNEDEDSKGTSLLFFLLSAISALPPNPDLSFSPSHYISQNIVRIDRCQYPSFIAMPASRPIYLPTR